MNTSKIKGFTLIEVMITIIIIAILASVATAAYRGYITKARRQAMQEDLLTMQQEAEEYYSLNHKYLGAFGTSTAATSKTVDGRNPFYTVTYCASACTAPVTVTGGYMITAVAKGGQTSDKECSTLMVYRNGTRLAETSAGAKSEGCW